MIKTQLNREDALQILELGRLIHQESRFRDEPFNDQKCWSVLNGTIEYPENVFIAYDTEFRGFIIVRIGTEFFNEIKRAQDMALYVKPEHRGSSLFFKLISAAEKWAKENGAFDLTINHNTGIEVEKAVGSFTKLGFEDKGRIFSKEL